MAFNFTQPALRVVLLNHQVSLRWKMLNASRFFKFLFETDMYLLQTFRFCISTSLYAQFALVPIPICWTNFSPINIFFLPGWTHPESSRNHMNLGTHLWITCWDRAALTLYCLRYALWAAIMKHSFFKKSWVITVLLNYSWVYE